MKKIVIQSLFTACCIFSWQQHGDKLDKTNLYTISQWIGLREQNIGAPPIFHGHFSVFPLDILDLLNICVGEKWWKSMPAIWVFTHGTRCVNWAAATAARRRARSVRMAAEHGSLAKNWPAEWLGQAQTTDRSDRGWGTWGWMAPRNKRSKKMETWWHVNMTYIYNIYIYCSWS